MTTNNSNDSIITTEEPDDNISETENSPNENDENDENKEEIWEVLQPKYCTKYVCPQCKHKSSFNPNYVKHKAIGCIKCETLETVCKRMLKCRGYELIK